MSEVDLSGRLAPGRPELKGVNMNAFQAMNNADDGNDEVAIRKGIDILMNQAVKEKKSDEEKAIAMVAEQRLANTGVLATRKDLEEIRAELAKRDEKIEALTTLLVKVRAQGRAVHQEEKADQNSELASRLDPSVSKWLGLTK